MEYLSLLGRILFGGFFIYSGLGHFMNLNNMAGYAGSKGVPMPKFMVGFSGLLLVLGGLGVLLNMYVKESALLLVAFLLPTTFVMHQFWKIQDPMAKMGDTINFSKNLALLGASLMLFASAMWKILGN